MNDPTVKRSSALRTVKACLEPQKIGRAWVRAYPLQLIETLFCRSPYGRLIGKCDG